jgi:hypothetical protein
MYRLKGSQSIFYKSIKYDWGTADFVRPDILGENGVTIVVREFKLLISADHVETLNSIKHISQP